MKTKRIAFALTALILALLLMAAFPAGDDQPATPTQPLIPVTGQAESAYPPPPMDLSAYPPPVDLKDPGPAATNDEDSLVEPDDGDDSDEREMLPKVYK